MQISAFAPPASCPLGTAAPKVEREERASAATHALGAILSVAGLAALIRAAGPNTDPLHTASALVFGVSLLVLYSASTVYHGLTNWRWKHHFRCLDYAGIFLLIAGTNTPILVMHLRNTLGWGLLIAVWGLCGLGMVLAVRYRFPWRSQFTSTLFYIALGWLALVVCRPLALVLPAESFRLFLLGGACYTVGTVFFAWDRLPYNHAIWHLFVLAGSGCHWLLIYRSLIAAGQS